MDILRLLDRVLPRRKFFTPKDVLPGWVGVKGGGKPVSFINVIEFDSSDTKPPSSSDGFRACGVVDSEVPTYNNIHSSYVHLLGSLEPSLEDAMHTDSDWDLESGSYEDALSVLGLLNQVLSVSESYFQSKLPQSSESDNIRAQKFAATNGGWEKAFGLYPDAAPTITSELDDHLTTKGIRGVNPALTYTVYTIVVMVNLRPSLRFGKDALGKLVPFVKIACQSATREDISIFEPCVPIFPAIVYDNPKSLTTVVYPALVLRIEDRKINVAELEEFITRQKRQFFTPQGVLPGWVGVKGGGKPDSFINVIEFDSSNTKPPTSSAGGLACAAQEDGAPIFTDIAAAYREFKRMLEPCLENAMHPEWRFESGFYEDAVAVHKLLLDVFSVSKLYFQSKLKKKVNALKFAMDNGGWVNAFGFHPGEAPNITTHLDERLKAKGVHNINPALAYTAYKIIVMANLRRYLHFTKDALGYIVPFVEEGYLSATEELIRPLEPCMPIFPAIVYDDAKSPAAVVYPALVLWIKDRKINVAQLEEFITRQTRKFFTLEKSQAGWVGVEGGGMPTNFINVVTFDQSDTKPPRDSAGTFACAVVQHGIPSWNDIAVSVREFRERIEPCLERVMPPKWAMEDGSYENAVAVQQFLTALFDICESYFQRKGRTTKNYKKDFGIDRDTTPHTTKELEESMKEKGLGKINPVLAFTIYIIIVYVNVRGSLCFRKDALGKVIPFIEDACMSATKKAIQPLRPCVPIFPALCYCGSDSPLLVVCPALALHVRKRKVNVAGLEDMITDASMNDPLEDDRKFFQWESDNGGSLPVGWVGVKGGGLSAKFLNIVDFDICDTPLPVSEACHLACMLNEPNVPTIAQIVNLYQGLPVILELCLEKAMPPNWEFKSKAYADAMAVCKVMTVIFDIAEAHFQSKLPSASGTEHARARMLAASVGNWKEAFGLDKHSVESTKLQLHEKLTARGVHGVLKELPFTIYRIVVMVNLRDSLRFSKDAIGLIVPFMEGVHTNATRRKAKLFTPCVPILPPVCFDDGKTPPQIIPPAPVLKVEDRKINVAGLEELITGASVDDPPEDDRKFFLRESDKGGHLPFGWVGVEGGGLSAKFLNIVDFDTCDTFPPVSDAYHRACMLNEPNVPPFSRIARLYGGLPVILELCLEKAMPPDWEFDSAAYADALDVCKVMRTILDIAEAHFQAKLPNTNGTEHARARMLATSVGSWEEAFGLDEHSTESTKLQLHEKLAARGLHGVLKKLPFTIYKIVVMVNLRNSLRLAKDAIGVVVPFMEGVHTNATRRKAKLFTPCVPILPPVCFDDGKTPPQIIPPAPVLKVEDRKINVAGLEEFITRQASLS